MAPSPQLLLGPLLCGTFLNNFLYGICVMQSFHYWRTFKGDPKIIRYFVFYILVLETLNAACNISMIYELLIIGYGDSSTTIYAPKMLLANPLITSLISTSAQTFTSWRIKVIGGSWVPPSIIVGFGLTSLGGGIALTLHLVLHDRRFGAFQSYHALIIIWLGASVIADILITGALYWFLSRRRTGHKATDDKISQILKLIIHTGLLSSTLAMADLVVSVAIPNTTINFIWDLMISQMYAIALLSTLNARLANASATMPDDNVLFGGNGIATDMRDVRSVHSRFSATPLRESRQNLASDPPHWSRPSPIPSGRLQSLENIMMDLELPTFVNRLEDSPTPSSSSTYKDFMAVL